MTYFDACAYVGRWPGGKLACENADQLLHQMQQLHIGKALVSHTIAWQNSPAMGNRLLTDAIAGHPELEPCWVITPGLYVDDLGGVTALCDQMDQNGVRAVRLYPRDHVFSLTGRASEELLSELNRRHFLLSIDLDQVFTQSGLYDYSASSLEVIDVLCKQYPDLSILLTRVGYRAFHVLFSQMQTNPNLYLDLSFFATHQGVETVVERLGASRLLFGTSQPLGDPGGALLRLKKAGIAQGEIHQIAGQNLEHLLQRVKVGSPSGSGIQSSTEHRDSTSGNSFDAISQDIEITDAHVHMGPYHKFYIPQNSPEEMIRVMDRLGIAQSCVSSHLAITGDWFLGNQLTARAVAEYPDRFIGYAVVSPNEPDLLEEELSRAFDEWGFRGIKLVPDNHGQSIGSEGYRPVFEFATRRRCFILVHTYHGSKYDDPQLFGSIATQYPDIPILMVHSGALPAAFEGAINLVKEHDNLYLDISGSFITGDWIRRMVSEAGADRVLFSSDQPFIDPRYSLGRLLNANLTPKELALVIGGNIRRLLGISDSR